MKFIVVTELRYVTPQPIGTKPTWSNVPKGAEIESIPFNTMSVSDRHWMLGIARRARKKEPNARFIGFEFDGIVRSAQIGKDVKPKRETP